MNPITKLWLIFIVGTCAAFGAVVLFRYFINTHPYVVATILVATIVSIMFDDLIHPEKLP